MLSSLGSTILLTKHLVLMGGAHGLGAVWFYSRGNGGREGVLPGRDLTLEMESLPPLGWPRPASPEGLGPSGARGPFDQGSHRVSGRGAAWKGLFCVRQAQSWHRPAL